MSSDRRKRILLVTRNLPPLVGGMERLNWHMAEELSKVADVRVVAPSGSAQAAPPGVSVVEVPLRPLWAFLMQATRCALREARRWRPDIVLAGSGLTALSALIAARASRALAVAYVHGLDLTAAHLVYRRIWLPALRRLDLVIANSHATARLAEQTGIASSKIGIVHPGVEMPEARLDPSQISAFRAGYGLGDRPLLLSVGRLSARKGLLEFVSKALPRIAAAVPDVLLLVVGDAPKDALQAQAQTPQSIEAAAAKVGVAGNLRFLGQIPDPMLSAAYAAADVHVFPIREISGDPEGFGMVAIEAAAHGLFTVAFASGGVTDAVSEAESGHLVPPGDYGALADAVLRVLRSSARPRGEACIAFAEGFAWPRFGARLIEQLSRLRSAAPSST